MALRLVINHDGEASNSATDSQATDFLAEISTTATTMLARLFTEITTLAALKAGAEALTVPAASQAALATAQLHRKVRHLEGAFGHVLHAGGPGDPSGN